MKLKSKNNSELEGTSEEIHDFCKNYGLNFDEFFEKPISKTWLICAGILWILLLIIAVFLPTEEIKFRTLLLLLMSVNSLGIGILIKRQFNQDYIAITIFLIVFSMVAVGFLPVEKMLDYLKN